MGFWRKGLQAAHFSRATFDNPGGDDVEQSHQQWFFRRSERSAKRSGGCTSGRNFETRNRPLSRRSEKGSIFARSAQAPQPALHATLAKRSAPSFARPRRKQAVVPQSEASRSTRTDSPALHRKRRADLWILPPQTSRWPGYTASSEQRSSQRFRRGPGPLLRNLLKSRTGGCESRDARERF